MASERNYWSVDQLWQDYNYHRKAFATYQNWARVEYERTGHVFRRTEQRIVAARENMKASYAFLCKRTNALLNPDLHASAAVEGWGPAWRRSNQLRY